MSEYQSIDQIQLEYETTQTKQLKLPRIDTNYPRTHNNNTRIHPQLPTIKTDPLIQTIQLQPHHQTDHHHQNLVGHVQRQLRIIMQEQNILDLDQPSSNTQDDFEQRIIQNRVLIKQAKRQNKKRKENQRQNSRAKAGVNWNSKLQICQKNRREIRDSSIENKPLQKKDLVTAFYRNGGLKEIRDKGLKEFREGREVPKSSTLLKQSSASNRELREVQSQKEDLIPSLKILPGRSTERDVDIRHMKKQLSHKFLNPIQKNEQLFDAIHNYLDNPKRTETEVSSKRVLRDRGELEDKLKQVEERLNRNQAHLRHKESTKTELRHSQKQKDDNCALSSQWRRIGVQVSDLVEEGSSFDQEVQRIDRYLQRNQQSLEKYVQNQKLLVEVQLGKRQHSRERGMTGLQKQR